MMEDILGVGSKGRESCWICTDIRLLRSMYMCR